jgi:trans-2,3-dihydro-3-hydroxyanthranilate isomerase
MVEVSTADGVATVEMTQRAPEFGRTYALGVVASAFGLHASDLLDAFPPQTVSTGTPMLMVPIRSREVLDRSALRTDRYRALHAEGDFFSPHLFWVGGATPEGGTYARQFGLPPDLPEDPFTGSATGAMAAYLWRYGLLPSRTFVAEQGHGMGRPGKAWVHVFGARDAIQGVRVRGEAVVVMRGSIKA